MNPAYRFGEKIAMRRGVKEMKKLYDAVESGTAADPYRNLDRIATDAPKVLGDRAFAGMGPALGSGAEGVAYPVLSHQGASVLKIHDPTSTMANPAFIDAKRQFIGHNIPNVTKIHQEVAMPGTVDGKKIPAFLQEYIPGRDYDAAHSEAAMFGHGWELDQKAKDVQTQLNHTTHQGHGLIDTGKHNMRVQPNGAVSVFDFMGIPQEKLLPAEQRPRGGSLSEHVIKGTEEPLLWSARGENDTILKIDKSGPGAWRGRSDREYAAHLANTAFAKPAAPRVSPLQGMIAGARANPLRTAAGVGLGVLGAAGALYGAHKLYKRWQDKPADEAVAP